MQQVHNGVSSIAGSTVYSLLSDHVLTNFKDATAAPDGTGKQRQMEIKHGPCHANGAKRRPGQILQPKNHYDLERPVNSVVTKLGSQPGGICINQLL